MPGENGDLRDPGPALKELSPLTSQGGAATAAKGGALSKGGGNKKPVYLPRARLASGPACQKQSLSLPESGWGTPPRLWNPVGQAGCGGAGRGRHIPSVGAEEVDTTAPFSVATALSS